MAKTKTQFDRERFNRRMVLSAYDGVGTLVTALIVLSLLLSYAFRVVGVDGRSMMPTFSDGDKLLLSTYDSSYQRGDVIVVDRYTTSPLIKRVIAVGGDTISIAPDGTVKVNGEVLQETYIQGTTKLNDFSGEATVPKGYLFVMGDNRSSSKDSRSAEVGFVSVKDVVGKAIFRVWPLNEFGSIDG